MTDPSVAVQEIKSLLDGERRRIADEIAHYPPPIPRCDAQYNALLEERAAVADALYRLDVLSRAEPGAVRPLLGELGAATVGLPGAAAERVRTLLARLESRPPADAS